VLEGESPVARFAPVASTKLHETSEVHEPESVVTIE
jgi:hypothetical protein